MRRFLYAALAASLLCLLIVPGVLVFGITALRAQTLQQEARAREEAVRAQFAAQREAERARVLAEEARVREIEAREQAERERAAAQRAFEDARAHAESGHGQGGEPPHRHFPPDIGERIGHIREAAEHLRLAGLEDPARDLFAEAERLEREAAEEHGHEAPHQVEALRGEVHELREQVERLSRQMRELTELIERLRRE